MIQSLGVLVLVTIGLADDVDYHKTLYDDFDFSLLSGDELKDAMLCLADRGPCTALVQSFRIHYPEAVLEACRRCNDKQKHIIRGLLDRVKKELPELYQAWRDLNDPNGKYFNKFEESTNGF